MKEFCRLDPPPPHHICSLYTCDHDFKTTLSIFLSQALHANAKILYIATTPDPILASDSLQELITSLDLTMKEDQWDFFLHCTSDQEATLEKLQEVCTSSKKKGFDSVHIITDLNGLAQNAPYFYSLVEFERLLNTFILERNLDCLVLCPYNSNRFPSHLLNLIVDVHPQCLIGEKLYNKGGESLQAPTLMEDQDAKFLSHKLDYLLKQQNHREVITKLYNQNEEFREISHMFAHDLKTHIRTAHLFNFILLNEHQGPMSLEIKEYLEKIAKSLHDANSRLESLNLLLQASKLKETLDIIHLDDILSQVTASFKTELDTISGQILYEAKSLPVIHGDQTQIVQLLRLIIDNCIKFRRPHIPLVIKLETHLFFNQTIKITITDNGQGFDQRYKKKIFQPFYRLHPDISSGCGMGLSICQKIVQQHNGDIMVESEEGAGTTMTIIFPLHFS